MKCVDSVPLISYVKDAANVPPVHESPILVSFAKASDTIGFVGGPGGVVMYRGGAAVDPP